MIEENSLLKSLGLTPREKSQPLKPKQFQAVEYTGDVEEDIKREVKEIEAQVIGLAKVSREFEGKMRVEGDDEFLLVACFQTKDERDQFVEKAGLDLRGNLYVDGWALAKSVGIHFSSEEIEPSKLKMDRDFISLVED